LTEQRIRSTWHSKFTGTATASYSCGLGVFVLTINYYIVNHYNFASWIIIYRVEV
jgi:hypothetical protein